MRNSQDKGPSQQDILYELGWSNKRLCNICAIFMYHYVAHWALLLSLFSLVLWYIYIYISSLNWVTNVPSVSVMRRVLILSAAVWLTEHNWSEGHVGQQRAFTIFLDLGSWDMLVFSAPGTAMTLFDAMGCTGRSSSSLASLRWYNLGPPTLIKSFQLPSFNQSMSVVQCRNLMPNLL